MLALGARGEDPVEEHSLDGERQLRGRAAAVREIDVALGDRMTDDDDILMEPVRPPDLPVDPGVPPSERDPRTTGPAGPDAAMEATSVASAAPPAQPAPLRPRGRARVRYVSGSLRQVLRARWDILAVIAAGGAAGSLGRWGLSVALPHSAGTFPWATFCANVSGSLLLGALMVFVIEVWPPTRYVRPFLGVGVLGGYTTFSTYMLEARDLLVAGRTAVAGQYVFGSLAAGLAAVWMGVSAARLAVRLAGRRRAALRDRTPERHLASAPSPVAAGPESPGAHGPPVSDPAQSIASTRRSMPWP